MVWKICSCSCSSVLLIPTWTVDSAYAVDLAYLLADLCSYNDLLLSYQYGCDIWIVPCRVLLG